MEISSLGGMQQGMGMRPMGPPQGDPAEFAENMSAEIMAKQDGDEDGLLSVDELGGDSDLLAQLDEDGDGSLTQSEFQSGLQSLMEEGAAAFESGSTPSQENRDLMQKLHSLAGQDGPPPPPSNQVSQAYSQMQDSMFSDTQTYSSAQTLIGGLNQTV